MSIELQIALPNTAKVPRVSAALVDDGGCDTLMILAPGAGAGIHHRFMTGVASHLHGVGIATLRFQFPYMEQGRKAPDRQPVLVDTITAVAAKAVEVANRRTIVAGGKSMGGRMTSIACADGLIEMVSGLVFLGFPLHAAGKPSRTRAAHLTDIEAPMLFIQGTRDRLADMTELKAVCSVLADRTTLFAIEGGDHSYQLLKSDPRSSDDVFAAVASEVRRWIDAKLSR